MKGVPTASNAASLLGVLVVLWTGATAHADPADVFPAETLAYVAVDPTPLQEGAHELDFGKLLADPALKKFLAPTFARLNVKPDNVLSSLLERMSMPGLWRGPAAFGLRGYEVRIVQNDGKVQRIRFGAKQAGATQIRQIVGAMLSVPFGKKPRFEVTLDFLCIVEPGPELEAYLKALLELAVETTDVTVAGKKLTRVRFASYHLFGEVDFQQTLFVERTGKRWVLASDPELTRLQPRVPLSATKRWRQSRDRLLVAHKPIVFGYWDAHQTWRTFRNLWPLALVEVAEDAGLAHWQSLACAVELHDGGLRESVGILIDKEAVGFWTLLDALPPGMRSPTFTPPGALMFLGTKHEVRVFRERLKSVMDTVAPGSFPAMEDAMKKFVATGGYDWQKDLLRAPGDEIAVMLMPPLEAGGLPRFVLGADYTDEEAMRSVMVKFRRQMKNWASYDSQDVALPNGLRGIQLLAPIPMHLTVALGRGHLFGSSDPRTLVRVLEQWGKPGAKSLVGDDPVFRRSLRGVCGGEPTECIALGYINVPASLALIHGWNKGFWPRAWFDRNALRDISDVTRHLKGVAAGLRRHEDGVTLDAQSPFGLLLPTFSWWLHDRIERFQARRVAEAQARERERLAAQSLAPDAPYLGVTLQRAPVTVLSAAENSPGKRGGLEKGDVIVKAAGEDVRNLDDLRRVMLRYKPGDEVPFIVKRAEKSVTLAIQLGRRGDFR